MKDQGPDFKDQARSAAHDPEAVTQQPEEPVLANAVLVEDPAPATSGTSNSLHEVNSKRWRFLFFLVSLALIAVVVVAVVVPVVVLGGNDDDDENPSPKDLSNSSVGGGGVSPTTPAVVPTAAPVTLAPVPSPPASTTTTSAPVATVVSTSAPVPSPTTDAPTAAAVVSTLAPVAFPGSTTNAPVVTNGLLVPTMKVTVTTGTAHPNADSDAAPIVSMTTTDGTPREFLLSGGLPAEGQSKTYTFELAPNDEIQETVTFRSNDPDGWFIRAIVLQWNSDPPRDIQLTDAASGTTGIWLDGLLTDVVDNSVSTGYAGFPVCDSWQMSYRTGALLAATSEECLATAVPPPGAEVSITVRTRDANDAQGGGASLVVVPDDSANDVDQEYVFSLSPLPGRGETNTYWFNLPPGVEVNSDSVLRLEAGSTNGWLFDYLAVGTDPPQEIILKDPSDFSDTEPVGVFLDLPPYASDYGPHPFANCWSFRASTGVLSFC